MDIKDQQAFNERVVAEYRAAAGRLTETLPGFRLLLLTTSGARTGREHTVPLGYVRHGGDLVVIASNRGAPDHPDWFRNLVEHPEVAVELDGERFAATAEVPSGERRKRVYAAVLAEQPFIADHQAATEREIPVVVLRRA
ncbi:nitroreductase family deazaflavin-dependent oxidoreductase [Allonocardiopsis opalescens]|uniref:Deazaflavin-dependent oxidoreductase (Nitroreductase family) n=1 Tax=Allonocardiopsis opalescens TaxID=1144618 RepID=A0A2T0Q5K6_9ACTN|nr:nitroreductase family deazaflavin-dependent oxidoreductase [Allonocardiopsis opalescens]PRX99064.1 deazaflavin-dependent oxidoreductase (nitroreductase family) [Allonocardiopsis opalescens]